LGGAARRGELAGGDLVSRDITDGELSPPVASPVSVWLTSGVTGPTGSDRVQLWVHCTGCTQLFERLVFKRVFEMNFQNL
jgi:hypothetical protein